MAIEKWIIGSDKKCDFQIVEEATNEAIPLGFMSGYGVVLYDHYGREIAKIGTGLTGFTNAVNVVDDTTFEALFDKEINTTAGYVYYRVFCQWADADFADNDFDAIGSTRGKLYYSEQP